MNRPEPRSHRPVPNPAAGRRRSPLPILPVFPTRDLTRLQRSLLTWFDRQHRRLPWRQNRDPYRIWVSEVMLQQTTVAAVVPVFERFLEAFPNLAALAAADEQQVLKLWEGLGYYRRARHLHAAARQLVAEHAGELPNDPAVWEALPGVGRYILGAVLSQAFDRRLPIVEANSQRVLTRLFGYPGDPRAGAGKAWVWQAAEAVLPRQRVGDFNQALMELGATVCRSTAPACDQCPLARQCVANREGLQSQIPPPKKPPDWVAITEVGVVIRDRDRVLLCQRPADADRWPNMWEIPHSERMPTEDLTATVVRVARELTGLDVEPGAAMLTVKHTVTRFRITLIAVEATVRGGQFASNFYTTGHWIKPTELARYPLSTPQRHLMTRWIHANRQPRLF